MNRYCMEPAMAAWVAKKFMYTQHTDADGPAHSPPARPGYTPSIGNVGEPCMPRLAASPS